MLHELKTIPVNFKHLSTFLLTGDSQEAALARLGKGQSTMTSAICIWVYIQHTVKHKIVLCGRRLWTQLCSCDGHATWWWQGIITTMQVYKRYQFRLFSGSQPEFDLCPSPPPSLLSYHDWRKPGFWNHETLPWNPHLVVTNHSHPTVN